MRPTDLIVVNPGGVPCKLEKFHRPPKPHGNNNPFMLIATKVKRNCDEIFKYTVYMALIWSAKNCWRVFVLH